MIPRTPLLLAGVLCAAALASLATGAPVSKSLNAHKSQKSAARDFYWYYYPIDSTGIPQDADGMTTGAAKLRYDSKGVPKVAYGRGQDVYYAELDGNAWKWQVADTAFKYEAKLTMDLDSEGNPHIVHEDFRYNVIHYAGYDGKAWKHKVLDTIHDETFGNFYALSLKVDGKKNLHLFYPRMNTAADGHSGATYGRFGTDLGLVRRDSLCSCGSSGKWAGLALDSKENPVMAFFTNTIEKAQVAYLNGDAKFMVDTLKTADAAGPNGQYASIAIDSKDSLFITHHTRKPDVDSWLLMTAGKAGGPYKTDTVAKLGGNPLWISTSPIALGKSATPYIAYLASKQDGQYRVSEGKLRLAWKTDAGWNTETIDSSSAITGLFPDIAINKDGLPSVVFYNYSKKQLWLAVARPDEPKDANSNGILDYQETPIVTVGLAKNMLKKGKSATKRGASLFDASGRKVKDVAAVKRLPTVAYPN